MPLDLDEVFAYRTVRLAEIRDYRVGIPYYLIVAIISIDIFVVQVCSLSASKPRMSASHPPPTGILRGLRKPVLALTPACSQLVMNGGYLAKETSITGSVRVSVQDPFGQYRKSTLDLPYCLDDCYPPDDCSGDFYQAQVQCPAIFSNKAFAKFPPLEGQGAAFITTRVDAITDELPRHCLPSASDGSQAATNQLKASTRADCYAWAQVGNRSFYVSQIEDYLIKVDHAMLAPTIRETKSGYDMASGAMLSYEEEDLTSSDPVTIDPCLDFAPEQYWAGVPTERRPSPLPGCPTTDAGFDGGDMGDWSVAVGANGADDVFPVSALLRAAGVKLSDTASAHTPETALSVRHGGVVLLLRIHYDNTWAKKWLIFPDTTQYRYRYQVLNVPDAGFEVSERVETDGAALRRTVNHRRGIRIVIKQTGEVGTFSFGAALVTCTTSLGLFAVAKLIVDLALEYLKRYAVHQDIKFHLTEKTTGKTISKSDLKQKIDPRKSRASGLEDGLEMQQQSTENPGAAAEAYTPPS